MRHKTNILALFGALLLVLTQPFAASASTPIGGSATYRFVTTIDNNTSTYSDSAALHFMSLNAVLTYDLAAVPVGTSVVFRLAATSAKPLTIDKNCCVLGGTNGTYDQQGVSTGNGEWTIVKKDGDTTANIKFYNAYDEFKDGKYASLVGPVTLSLTAQIGQASPAAIQPGGLTKFTTTATYATYSRNFTMPKNVTQVWFEDYFDSTSTFAKGTRVQFTQPVISITNSSTKRTSVFAYKNHGFSFSINAHDKNYTFNQSSTTTSFTIQHDGSYIGFDQGIYLPTSTPAGSKILATAFKITG
jgi:hypothetical protein